MQPATHQQVIEQARGVEVGVTRHACTLLSLHNIGKSDPISPRLTPKLTASRPNAAFRIQTKRQQGSDAMER